MWVQAGTEVYIEAHLKTRGWVQTATGRTVTRTAILAERILELPAVPPKQLIPIVVPASTLPRGEQHCRATRCTQTCPPQ